MNLRCHVGGADWGYCSSSLWRVASLFARCLNTHCLDPSFALLLHIASCSLEYLFQSHLSRVKFTNSDVVFNPSERQAAVQRVKKNPQRYAARCGCCKHRVSAEQFSLIMTGTLGCGHAVTDVSRPCSMHFVA